MGARAPGFRKFRRFGEIDRFRSLKLPVDRSFLAFLSRINEDGASIKIDSSLKQEDIGLMGKEVAEYVKEQQTLDRQERAA